MRWEDERYVRVYTRDTAEWLALGWEAQALLVLLLRKADRAGIIQTGKAGVRGIAALAGMPLDVVHRALPVLLEDGCLRVFDGGGYVFPNFLAAQEARSSDAQRKREQRARDRDKAVAGGACGSVTGVDVEAQMSRAAGHDTCHASRHSVTPDSHTASRNVPQTVTNVTPCLAVLSRAVPEAASQAAAVAAPVVDDGLPDATGHAEEVPEGFALTPQPAGKKPRQPSKAEALYAGLQKSRLEACERAGVPFRDEGWAPARQNKNLGPLARLEASSAEAELLNAAWGEYLADERQAARNVPWSVGWFLTTRAEYEGKVLREAGGTP